MYLGGNRRWVPLISIRRTACVRDLVKNINQFRYQLISEDGRQLKIAPIKC